MNAGESPLTVTLVAQSVDDATGLGRIASALAAEYGRAGHAVHIVSQRCAETTCTWHRVPDLSLTPALGKISFRVFEGRKTRQILGSVVHAFGVGAEADVVAAQSCHKAAVSIQANRGNERIHRRNLGIYDRLSLNDERRLFTGPRRKRIVAVSRLVRLQILEEYNLPEESVCIIPNGVHLDRFRREQMADGSGRAASGPFILLFVGNEFDRKGLQTIIEALPLLSDLPIELHVAGSDDPGPYKRRAADLKVLDRLKFLGSVRAPESLFAQADALVFPTHYEPFGMVIIEAMAAGIPVITTRTAGAVEDMIDGVHGLYFDDAFSADEVSRRIRTVFENAPLRESLCRDGRIAAERYAWPLIASRHIDLYRTIGAR
jgi:glycosyltransferase involved in cell wall biosynthesis